MQREALLEIGTTPSEAAAKPTHILEVLPLQEVGLFQLNIYEASPDQADAEGNPLEQRICSVELDRQTLAGFSNYCSKLTLRS